MFGDDAGGRHRKEEPELPSFTGDVPSDAIRTCRLFRDRVLTALTKTKTSIGGCLALALIMAGVLTALAELLPAGLGEQPATLACYGALTAVAAAASLLPVVPGAVRLLCGAFAYGFAFLFAMAQFTGSLSASPWPGVAGTVGTWVMLAVYCIVGGRRLTRYARSRR